MKEENDKADNGSLVLSMTLISLIAGLMLIVFGHFMLGFGVLSGTIAFFIFYITAILFLVWIENQFYSGKL